MKPFSKMTEEERKKQKSKNYLKSQYFNDTQEIINYGREVENETEYSLALMEVIDRYVTLDKVI